MNKQEIEWWRDRDLNQPKGYTPVLELLGRKQRLEHAIVLAEEQSIELDADSIKRVAQLFNIYYDWLTITAIEK